MALHFVPTGGMAPFSMQVGYYDTVQEIKKKIQTYHNIPAQKQTLIFNNQTLPDDLIMFIYSPEITDNSHIQLIISDDQESSLPPLEKPTTVTVNQESPPPSPENPTTVEVNQESTPETPETTSSELGSSSMEDFNPFDNYSDDYEDGYVALNKITLILRHSSLLEGFPIELDDNDSIRVLKEKIVQEVDKGLQSEKIIVRSNGVELHDHNTLLECGLFDQAEIEVSFKRSPPSNNNNDNNPKNSRIRKIPKGLKELKIMVLTLMFGTEKIPVEVNECYNVGVLRKEVEKVNQGEGLNLSQEGFYFMHKEAVMEEHQGDTIEIVNGGS